MRVICLEHQASTLITHTHTHTHTHTQHNTNTPKRDTRIYTPSPSAPLRVQSANLPMPAVDSDRRTATARHADDGLITQHHAHMQQHDNTMRSYSTMRTCNNTTTRCAHTAPCAHTPTPDAHNTAPCAHTTIPHTHTTTRYAHQQRDTRTKSKKSKKHTCLPQRPPLYRCHSSFKAKKQKRTARHALAPIGHLFTDDHHLRPLPLFLILSGMCACE